MRRLLILIFALLGSWSAAAEENVWQILQRVSRFMNAEKGYEVKFSIDAEGFASKGRYCVKDDAYYIEVADAEVYSDGKVRYEVDNARQEVNIDNMDGNSRNILDNPTRCFDFVEEDYEAAIVEQDENEAVVRLKAKDNSVEGEIILTVERKSACPKSVEYRIYDDRIYVKVEAVNHAAGAVKNFARSAYKDYEMIDFR